MWNERSANLSLVETGGRVRRRLSEERVLLGDIYESAKVVWFGCVEEIVCNRYDLILNAFFDFEPVKRLEYWEM